VELSKTEQALLDRVKRRFDFADSRIHKKFRDRCDEQYSLYNNYDSLKQDLRSATSASERERLLGQGQNMFGASMFIPFIFSTIETILPRMAANTPKPRLRPARPGLEMNAMHMEALLAQQLPAMKYGLSVQDTAKHGLWHGIGVRKNTWVKNTRESQKWVKNDDSWGTIPFNDTIYDDPYSGDIDPRNWIWDPFASSVETAEWCIHRTWRSDEFVKKQFETGQWTLPEKVRLDDVMGQHKDDEYASLYNKRAEALKRSRPATDAGKIHEVWEYHDGKKVCVILDRAVPVSERDNPHWHNELPFTIFRPISLPGEMVGRSVVDALEDLQIELNTLRAQRRDGASMALETPYAYRVGKVDPAHIRWGRGQAIPVDGKPDDVLHQMRVNDVPGSSYQEENGLKDDIQRTAGVMDISGGSSTTETATGAQLVYTEANERIKNMVKRLEEETIVDDFRLMIQMNQQHKIKFAVQTPVAGPPPLPGEPDARWKWFEGDPTNLEGHFLPTVEPGSTAAENIPQNRSDVQMWVQMFQNPYIDQRKATEKILELLGARDPSLYLVNEQQVPASVTDEMLGELERQGLDPSMLQGARDAVMEPHDQALAQSQMAGAPQ
jgi:hypothetical protein